MKFLKSLKPSNWGLIKIWRDIDNYRDFMRVIKAEKANSASKFNKWDLKHNMFYTIYFTMDIKEEEAQLPEEIKRMRLVESLGNLHRYLDDELGFAECITPEFNQFFDDEGKPTLTYLITYRFSFNKLSLGYIIKWALLTTGAILGYQFLSDIPLVSNILSIISTWLQTLNPGM